MGSVDPVANHLPSAVVRDQTMIIREAVSLSRGLVSVRFSKKLLCNFTQYCGQPIFLSWLRRRKIVVPTSGWGSLFLRKSGRKGSLGEGQIESRI